LGFSDEELVSLFGRRTLGFKDISGKHKDERWSRNPYVFDNNYYEELLDQNSPYIKTNSDLALLEDRNFKQIIEQFSRDQERFFEVYATAHQKMSELGCSGLLGEEVVEVEEKLCLN
jgi:catalase (peroxidase I)